MKGNGEGLVWKEKGEFSSGGERAEGWTKEKVGQGEGKGMGSGGWPIGQRDGVEELGGWG